MAIRNKISEGVCLTFDPTIALSGAAAQALP
jgi:hypothetical protein